MWPGASCLCDPGLPLHVYGDDCPTFAFGRERLWGTQMARSSVTLWWEKEGAWTGCEEVSLTQGYQDELP